MITRFRVPLFLFFLNNCNSFSRATEKNPVNHPSYLFIRLSRKKKNRYQRIGKTFVNNVLSFYLLFARSLLSSFGITEQTTYAPRCWLIEEKRKSWNHRFSEKKNPCNYRLQFSLHDVLHVPYKYINTIFTISILQQCEFTPPSVLSLFKTPI